MCYRCEEPYITQERFLQEAKKKLMEVPLSRLTVGDLYIIIKLFLHQFNIIGVWASIDEVRDLMQRLDLHV